MLVRDLQKRLGKPYQILPAEADTAEESKTLMGHSRMVKSPQAGTIKEAVNPAAVHMVATLAGLQKRNSGHENGAVEEKCLL